jgi:mutator protein MutT
MERAYPTRPIVGVGAVIVTGERRVILVRRAREPLAGQWSLPGGAVELGETLPAALAREVREETGLEVDVGPVVEVLDRIFTDDDGRVRHHYVLVDYLCRPRGGDLQAGTDAVETAAVDPASLDEYGLRPETRAVINRALAIATD